MSLVKTLQQQNQQTPIRSANFEPDKKHLSADFFNRVPPPAHHNTFNQQVQNGYFDFERWNSAKMFSTPSSFAAAQNNHSGKFSIPTPHVQPQPANYGPVPTYIPPLTSSSPIPEAVTMADVNNSLGHQNPDTDKLPAVESTAESTSNQLTESTCVANPLTTRNVPSIEEELGLIQCDVEQAQTKENLVRTKTNNVGFMNEFIKFVQSGDQKIVGPKATKHPLENECASNVCVKIMKPAASVGKLHFEASVEEERSVNQINNGESQAVRSVQSRGQPRVSPVPVDRPNSVVSVSKNGVNQVNEKFPYSVGEFVVVKSDLHVLHPPIWKVKKNLLLQKFTHFVSRGVTFYSNVPVFTGWSPGTKKVYEKVQIRIIKQKKEDMIVKLISTNMLALPSGSLMVKLVEENKKYREDFEIYVQALFSQALDSTFLREILQEKDDYFLKSIRTVEGFWLEIVTRLKEALTWSKGDVEKLSSSPNYRYVRGVWTQDNCVCSKPATTRVALGGLPYTLATLELSKTPVPQQSVSLCNSCTDSFELLHKLTHQKYALFSVCDDIVSAKKVECLNNDASIILNDLLKDDDWFDKTFSEFLKFWGYAGKVTQDLARLKKINNCTPSTDV
uniref:Glutamine and serine-rich protein 1 n=1 Tax=Lygus hesperus TaxID=30085 RepID=A0A0A9WXN3_LYGHE